MDRPLKVGWFSDYCFGGTGFGTVAKNVLAGLAATGRYELHHLACGIKPREMLAAIKKHAETTPDDQHRRVFIKQFEELNARYCSVTQLEWHHVEAPINAPFKVYANIGDRYGRACLMEWCKHLQLDCCVVNLDPWMSSWISTQFVEPWRKPCPIIFYQPIDAVCVGEYSPHIAISMPGAEPDAARNRIAWSHLYCVQDFTVFYGQWALDLAVRQIAKEIVPVDDSIAEQANLYSIRHGVDTATFRSVPKNLARAKLGIPQDAFVVGMVAANQTRKDWPAFVKVLKVVGDKIPNLHYIMWTSLYRYPDAYDLPKLTEDIGVNGTCIHFPFLDEVATVAPLFVNLLYNALDVHLLTHRGEGCGLPHIEASAVGIPAFATDYAGITDYFADEKQKIPTSPGGWFAPNLLLRPEIDIGAAADRVMWVHDNPEEATQWAKSCAEIASTWTWQTTVPAWERVIADAAAVKAAWDDEHYAERQKI